MNATDHSNGRTPKQNARDRILTDLRHDSGSFLAPQSGGGASDAPLVVQATQDPQGAPISVSGIVFGHQGALASVKPKRDLGAISNLAGGGGGGFGRGGGPGGGPGGFGMLSIGMSIASALSVRLRIARY